MNNALRYELEQYLKERYGGFIKEKPIRELLPTKRMFRADYYIPVGNFTIEINGGSWAQGRHVRGKGYENDLIKINLLQKHHIRCFQYTFEMLKERLYHDDI